ncbi:conserved hypothetical protein [Histoplasma capsulatum var. duboisii H88]|uniref:Secreted protein n=2 Tax=Ajellomyces capsulatus TaxID=5037 RepID=F0UQP1_AJEC8|nr:conserved hypothetical protein [Histoplasma capsulatum H143]EGC48218.1 conserved hypothetical protein [Histoplasma capsulatum var. duboisii H88]
MKAFFALLSILLAAPIAILAHPPALWVKCAPDVTVCLSSPILPFSQKTPPVPETHATMFLSSVTKTRIANMLRIACRSLFTIRRLICFVVEYLSPTLAGSKFSDSDGTSGRLRKLPPIVARNEKTRLGSKTTTKMETEAQTETVDCRFSGSSSAQKRLFLDVLSFGRRGKATGPDEGGMGVSSSNCN